MGIWTLIWTKCPDNIASRKADWSNKPSNGAAKEITYVGETERDDTQLAGGNLQLKTHNCGAQKGAIQERPLPRAKSKGITVFRVNINKGISKWANSIPRIPLSFFSKSIFDRS